MTEKEFLCGASPRCGKTINQQLEEDYKDVTIGDLIDELEEYPLDTPIWPQLHLPWGMLMLDFEFVKYASLDNGESHELHLVFKQSKIYDLKRDDE